jgi:hypothetical protein
MYLEQKMELKDHAVNLACGVLVLLLTVIADEIFILPQLITAEYANGFLYRHDLLEYASLGTIVPQLVFGFLAAVLALKLTAGITRRRDQMTLAITSCILVLVFAVAALVLCPEMSLMAALPGWLVGYPIGAGWEVTKRYT